MKKILLVPGVFVFLLSCTNDKKEIVTTPDTKIMLRTDTLNVVRLTDSLVIYQSVCRGCAYEESTHFEIGDSLGIIKFADVITKDNNPPNVDGGTISKDLILLPVKTGLTTIRMYKFIDAQPTAEDSTHFASYTIEVRN